MSEIELRFLLDKAAPSEIWSRVQASKLTSGARSTKALKTIYLDTPDHSLKKAGIALRIRRDGRRWVQTVKPSRALHGGLSRAGEIENSAPGGRVCLDAIPDASVQGEIIRLVGGAVLAPVCETVMKRTSNEIVLQDGTRAEIAIDVGEVRAGGHAAELAELEVELLEGNPAGLYDIAHVLLPAGGLRFSRLSRAARGYLLAEEARIDAPLAPRNAQSVPIEPDQTAEQAARDILRECLDQIATNLLAVGAQDEVEGPHQLRIGLRRLRSAFATFRPVLHSSELMRLGEEARWLGREVGKLRDLDVVANELVRQEAQNHADEPTLFALTDALLGQARQRREQLRPLLVGPRVQAFLIDLARFVETRGWLVPQDFDQTRRLAEPVAEFAGEALDKRWKKLGKRTSGLKALTVEQRHELRKELKKLRYTVEFLSSLFPAKRVDQFLKRLKRLQDAFGGLNDAATVKAMFRGADSLGAEDARLQRAIGWMIGASQVRAELGWADARRLWRDLEQTGLFWR